MNVAGNTIGGGGGGARPLVRCAETQRSVACLPWGHCALPARPSPCRRAVVGHTSCDRACGRRRDVVGAAWRAPHSPCGTEHTTCGEPPRAHTCVCGAPAAHCGGGDTRGVSWGGGACLLHQSSPRTRPVGPLWWQRVGAHTCLAEHEWVCVALIMATHTIIIQLSKHTHRQCQGPDPGQGGHPSRPTTIDLCRQTARRWSHHV